MRKQNRNTGKKEKTIMIASSIFVLAALTMTGIYVKSNEDKAKNDGYNIDFSLLEEEENDYIVQNKKNDMGEEFLAVPEDDLDYAPMEEAGSGDVEIPGLTNGHTLDIYQNLQSAEVTEDEGCLNEEPADTIIDAGILGEEVADAETDITSGEDAESASADDIEVEITQEMENAEDLAAMEADEVSADAVEEPVTAQFQAGTSLVWPVSGSVLIPYSMDKTVFFSTLEQYKYNPAMILSANEGDVISAVASGRVTDVFYDEEIGNAVSVDIGNGYEVIYGQLKDIAVTKGALVEKGAVLGYIAAPTMYYSVEGTNAYFKLTLNGEAVDPLGQLQ